MGSLRRGEAVEVRSAEEGFKGAWYPATLIRRRDSEYVVEFKDLIKKSELREKVEADHIRPVPPNLIRQHFVAHEIVDAHDKDGWWTGSIENVLPDNNYVVHFTHSGEKVEYHVSQLRLHLNWINGEWLQTPQPSENTVSISPNPERENTRPNKFKREANFCGPSADGVCVALAESERKLRKTSKDKLDDGSSATGTMNTAGKDVEGAKSVPIYKEGGKSHSSAPLAHALVFKGTEVPFSEAKLEQVENILPAGGVTGEVERTLDACETGANPTMKKIEIHAFHSVLYFD